jgi:hypothetical protein
LPNLSIEIVDPAARLWYICAERGSFLFHFIDVSLDPLLPFCFPVMEKTLHGNAYYGICMFKVG